jgi:hypothetical protein
MNVCFNCGCSLDGKISGQYADYEVWLCLKCLLSLLGMPTGEAKELK